MFVKVMVAASSCVLIAACGSESGDAGAATGGAGGSQVSDSGSELPDCDPRGTTSHDAGGTSDAASPTDGPVLYLDGGNIDLDSGTDPPFGYLKCYDPATGAGFDCTQSQMICCEKKDNCYDPAADPAFCDRAWCPTR